MQESWISVVGIFIVPLLLLFGLSLFAFWLWMLVDCLKYEPSGGNDKVVWVLVIIFAQIVGALVYFFVRRQPRNAAMHAE